MVGRPVLNARAPEPSTDYRPALGGGGRLPRKILMWEALIAFVLLILLVIAKHVVGGKEVGPNPLSALPGGSVVSAGLDIGGDIHDSDAIALADSYNVTGLINLNGANAAEQVTASFLHIGYLNSPVAPNTAPGLGQLETMATFMRTHATNGNSVYVHDADGGGSAVTTACMLLLLRGDTWSAVQHDIASAGLSELSSGESHAIAELTTALNTPGRHISGNPYSGAKTYPW
jgi:hypothetical protein